MGLTEKKVMFLTKDGSISLNNNGATVLLDPLRCPNLKSIINADTVTIGPTGHTQDIDVKTSNWDKFCILGIYIKMQPKKNQWTGAAGAQGVPADTINEVKCTYAYNNCPEDMATAYDKANINNKQVFTFNSNEAFTIYIPAPPTMSYREAYEDSVTANVVNGQGTVTVPIKYPQHSDCVVHKSKTWWSIVDLRVRGFGDWNLKGDEDSMEEEGDSDMIGTPADNSFSPVVHAGRLYFQCAGAADYNYTINYKVALKG